MVSINWFDIIKLVLTLGIADVPKMLVTINGETALYLVTSRALVLFTISLDDADKYM